MTQNPNILFLDLVAPHRELEAELVEVFRTALTRGAFIGGPMVEEFENEFARFCETSHCVGVSSGTDALRFALIAAGVGPDQIVITVPHTFIATTEAISQAGAWPDFVDVDPRTCNLDVEKLREYLQTRCWADKARGKTIHRQTGRVVSAVVPVHLYGQTADMDAICELAEAHRLIVVEDACQAHGARYFSNRTKEWRTAGSMGRAAAFSFYPGKNLGACGEAGAVTTQDPEIARRVRVLREHGQAEKYYHDIEGYNGRLDAIQAGILRIKLRHLEDWNRQRRAHALAYNSRLASVAGLTVPFEPSWSRAVYHLYVVRTPHREALRRFLSEAGIGTGIHYPIPLHLQKAYAHRGFRAGDFPMAEGLASEILSLPMYPQLRPEQIERVVDAVQKCMQECLQECGQQVLVGV